MTDAFLGRIITKTQTETEYITSPGTMPFSLRTLLVISCHPDWTFSFSVKYDYCLPSQVPSVPFIDILMLASTVFNNIFPLSGKNQLNFSPDVPLHIPQVKHRHENSQVWYLTMISCKLSLQEVTGILKTLFPYSIKWNLSTIISVLSLSHSVINTTFVFSMPALKTLSSWGWNFAWCKF